MRPLPLEGTLGSFQGEGEERRRERRGEERRSFYTLGSPLTGKTISCVRKMIFRGTEERAKIGLW